MMSACTAFAGCHLALSSKQPGWQVWNEKDEQDEVLAMVVRTGLHTFVGQMVTPLVDRHWASRQPELRTPLGLLRQVSLLMLNFAGKTHVV